MINQPIDFTIILEIVLAGIGIVGGIGYFFWNLLDKRFDKFDQRLDKIDQRIENIQNCIQTIDSRMSRLEGQEDVSRSVMMELVKNKVEPKKGG